MKGYILLSEGRSGSNWLSSMSNNTKRMGRCTEWLGREYFDREFKTFSEKEFIAAVFENAVTQNDRFAIKIFPRHLYSVYMNVGFDFLRKCLEEHDTKLMLLKRRDTMSQAISWVRGMQTRQWTSRSPKKEEEFYDFAAICRAYFYINRSYQYWDAYLGVNGYEYESHVYEDLLPDPTPYLNSLVEFLEVDHDGDWNTELRIQRDNKTQEWLERFREDIKTKEIIGYSGPFGAYESFSKEQPRAPSGKKRRAKSALKKVKGLFS